VAKTRRSVKKKSARATGKKPMARKSAKKAVKPRKPAAPSRIELKKLRKDFSIVLSLLTAKSGSSPEVTAKLDDTRRRISQWMTDVDDICTPELQEICGPDMAFPVPNP
jgi:hypothetical protein